MTTKSKTPVAEITPESIDLTRKRKSIGELTTDSLATTTMQIASPVSTVNAASTKKELNTESQSKHNSIVTTIPTSSPVSTVDDNALSDSSNDSYIPLTDSSESDTNIIYDEGEDEEPTEFKNARRRINRR